MREFEFLKANDPEVYSAVVNETKRQPLDREKILAKYVTDNELISYMYKQLIQLNIKKKSKSGQKT